MRTRLSTWRHRLFLTSVFFAIGALSGLRGQSRSPDEKVAFVPFISHERELRVGEGDDKNPYEVDSTYARRSDGSTAVSSFSIPPYAIGSGTGQSTLIFDPGHGVDISLEPNTKSVTTTHLSSAQVSSRLADEHACDSIDPDTILIKDSESILGYATDERIDTFPDERSESWVATTLDCYPLKETTQFLGDRAGGHNEDTVLDVREGDPPAAMFSVPTDYVERSPQQLEAVYEAMFPGHMLYSPPILKKLEESYEGLTNLK